MKIDFKSKSVIVFDLDGTLTKSKLPLDRSMVKLMIRLLKEKKVAIVGGGKIDLFKRQILQKLPSRSDRFQNLFLFPTNGTAMYAYKGVWKNIYKKGFFLGANKRIKAAIYKALLETGSKKSRHIYGALIEDRGTQITFSALGQKAPLAVKERWNKSSDIRPRIVRLLQRMLPDFEVHIGGLTSIDITKKGIDKAYAIGQIQKKLHVSKKNMLFIGDALYPGGNDYAAIRTGVKCIKVSGPGETRKVIEKLL